MYSKRPNLVLGFHGCDKKTADLIIKGETFMNESTNDCDWLGNGIYFWENNLIRALEFAKEQKKRLGKDGTPKVENPAVVGVVIQKFTASILKKKLSLTILYEVFFGKETICILSRDLKRRTIFKFASVTLIVLKGSLDLCP